MSLSSPTTAEQTIRRAIARREALVLTYNGVERIVQPHIFGYGRGGQLALSAWQIAGTGSGWRLFYLALATNLSPAGFHFLGTAPGYNPDDPSFIRVLARMDPEDRRRPEGTKEGRQR